MLSSPFLPLVGVAFSFFTGLNSVSGKPSSIPFTVRGSAVQFLADPSDPGDGGVTTNDNAFYVTTIALGGLNLTVQLDTGSSDLVVDLKGRQINLDGSSDIPAQAGFGSGSVSGTVQFADLQIGGFVINSQAFLDISSITGSVFPSTLDGILGMSFNGPGSHIESAIATAQGQDAANQLGNTPIVSLFSQQSKLPNSFDVQLGRSDGTSEAQGTFIIGEHDNNFQQIANAPPLPSLNEDHWTLVMDAMLINGQPFAFNASGVQGLPQGKIAAVVDTGVTFPPLPPAAVDAIYRSIPGAVFDQTTSLWEVPCNASTNLSFVFANQEFAIHPLDLTVPTVITSPTDPSQKVTVCLNTFRYLALDPNQFGGFDTILGDAFLRNVYASFNYGNANTGPFVQMVTTMPDSNTAMQEFQTQRAAALAKLPPTLDAVSQQSSQASQSSAPSGTAAQTSTAALQSTTTTSLPADIHNGSAKGGVLSEHAALAAFMLLSGLVMLV
ncbi:acid protease [Pilatotrama ljubarskyi]|nr:acid protease [Pilatotrama ljubarskyi]